MIKDKESAFLKSVVLSSIILSSVSVTNATSTFSSEVCLFIQSKNAAFDCSLSLSPSHIYGIIIIMLLGITPLLSIPIASKCTLNSSNVVVSINTFFLSLPVKAAMLDFRLSTIIGSVIFLLISKNAAEISVIVGGGGGGENIASNDFFDF